MSEQTIDQTTIISNGNVQSDSAIQQPVIMPTALRSQEPVKSEDARNAQQEFQPQIPKSEIMQQPQYMESSLHSDQIHTDEKATGQNPANHPSATIVRQNNTANTQIPINPPIIAHSAPVVTSVPAHSAANHTDPLKEPSASHIPGQKESPELLLVHLSNELAEEKRGKELTVSNAKKSILAQKSVLSSILARLNLAVHSCQVLLKYFNDRAAVSKLYANSLKQLPNLTTLGELGTLEHGLDYLGRVSTSEVDNHSKFAATITDHLSKHLSTLLSELTAEQKRLSKEEARLNRELDQALEKTGRGFEGLEGSLVETKVAIEGRKDILKDPWLYQIQCFDAINQLYLFQTGYNSQIVEIFQEVEKLDRHRLDTLKSLMKNFALAQKASFGKVAADIDVALGSIENISSNDWNQFTTQTGLAKQSVFPQQGPVSNVPEKTQPPKLLQPFSSKSVIRVGQLEIGGMFRWSPYFFALTKYGFLHYFSNNQNLQPEGSIPLAQTTLVITEPSKNSFQLEHSPPGFFSSTTKYLLRASKEIEMVEWIIDLKKFTKTH